MNTSCWVITENLIGTQNQCVALARAAGLDPVLKTISLRQPWKTLGPWIPHFIPRALGDDSAQLTPPPDGSWPDIIIASGRKAIAPALWVKKQSGNAAKLVIVQSPIIKNPAFDLVVVPRHDRYRGDNVLEVTGALSIITPAMLDTAKNEWRDRFETMTAPRLGVLIGGNSRTHTLTDVIAHDLAKQLSDLTKTHSLMITASRRTPPHLVALLRDRLTQSGRVFFWDGGGDNPYRGILAWADAFLVTSDSVSMLSETISTGKPVHIIPLAGGSARFARFYDHLIQKNYVRWFTGTIDQWSYSPPDDVARAAAALRALMDGR